MGKNRVIKSLGKRIGNIVVHKILVKHTNKPESIPHLNSEVEAYRENVFEDAQEYNWNESDKAEIKEESIKEFKNRITSNYPDVKYTQKEAEELIEETIEECI